MTLIEVMIAGAIMAIAMTVTAAIFTTLATQKREAERLLEVQSVGVGAVSQLQVDLTNAGFRFPAPTFALHVYNAPVALVSGQGAAGTTIDATAGCGAGGLQPGSDAVELVMGYPGYTAGKVAGVDAFPPVSVTTDHNVVLESATPFTVNDDGVGVALFYEVGGDSCIGRVTAGPSTSSPPAMNVTMMDRDFNDVARTLYPTCPRIGMSVFRMAQRKRYFVCSEPGDAGTLVTSMYRQATPVDGGWYGYAYTTPPDLVQDGVEDLQVSARVYARAPVMTGGGQDCFGPLGAGEGYCFCDYSVASACALATDPNVTTIDHTSWASWVSGLRIGVTALGHRPLKDPGPGGTPAEMDRIAGTNYDGKRRIYVESGVGLSNLTQVRP